MTYISIQIVAFMLLWPEQLRVIWMPNLESQVPEKDAPNSAVKADKVAKSTGDIQTELDARSDRIASKRKKKCITKDGKLDVGLLVSEDSVAARTRSRKEKYQANMHRSMLP